MIDRSWLTSHERVVLTSALAEYRAGQAKKKTNAALAKTRAMAGANEFVASNLLQQLNTK